MKKGLVILGLVALAALVLWVSASISEAARAVPQDDDPDVPRTWKNVMSKEEYMLRRAEHIALLRGIGTGLPFNPTLRMQAIAQLDEQQRSLLAAARAANSAAGEQSSSAAAISGTWTPIGPFPIPNGQTVGVSTPVSGRTVTIAVHPTTPDIAYVGTAQGGLYRTTNGGATWTTLMDGAMSLAIGTVVLAPSNPEVVFVGTGEQSFSADSFFGVGLYRIENASSAAPTIVGPLNRDAANNDVFSGRAIGEILVHPTDPNIIFVGSTSGIGGIGGGGTGPLANLPNRGLFRSTNAMSASPTFTKLAVTSIGVGENRNIVDLAMEPGNPNRIIASVVGTPALATDPPTAADNGGLFLTTNALDPTPTFTKTLDIAGTTSTATRTELAINKVGGTLTIYAASALNTGTVFRSTDGGQTWVQAVNNNFCSPQCFYDIAIDVDPGNASRVYLGGSPALPFGISTNSGASFSTSANGLHVDSHAIAVAPSNPQVIYFGSDGGIYRSNDAGATWTSLSNTTYSATQFMSVAIHPSDPNFTIGGTQDNGTNMLRFDGTWRRTDYGDGGYAAIDQSSSATGATMYHTYFNSNAPGGSVMGYAFSEDPNAFENWTFRGCQITGAGNGITCTDSVLFYAPLETGPGTPNTVYYGTDRLYRSDNKGLVNVVVSQAPIEVNTATTPPGGIPISAIGISPTNDNIRIVGLRTGGIWGTTNGSPVLTNLDPTNTVPNTFVARAAIDPNNPNTAYVTLSAFGITNIWKTTSLTTPNWTSASGSDANALPQVPVNAFMIDPANSNRLLAGTDIGVYSSEDGGANWMPVGSGLPRVAVFDLGITSERKLRIATHGRGMWEILLPGSSTAAPNPIFSGLAQVTDSQQCDGLTLTWLPAVSANQNADIVYDIYRVTSVAQGNGTQDPTFTPSAANRIQTDVSGTSFTDTGLMRNQLYYYVVQARDRNNGRIDTNNTGNTVVRFSAPTSPNSASPAIFATETFEASAANNRFTPPLQDSATPNQSLPAFQRVPSVDFGGTSSTGMYAPDFDPGSDGAPSEFSAIIGPFSLTGDSVMEFDHFFRTESSFDGGVMELAIGGPNFNATPFPDNVTTFDLGNHMIQNGYNGKLDGTFQGAFLSPLQGRRAFTGSRGLSHVKISLRAFAGGVLNPAGLPVYIRFRMTSDAATAAGAQSGWYIDNVAINNLAACAGPTPTPTPTPIPTPTPNQFSFSPSVRVYDSTSTNAQTGGEPSLELDSSDRVYVAEVSGRLWRSSNAGDAWKFLGAFDPGGDADLEFDALGRLYASALVVGQGLTSTVNRYSHPATMNSVDERDFKTNTYPLNDRQWLATYGNDTVYLGFHDIGPENVYVTKSTNGGQSFGPPIPVITDPALLANTIPNTNDGRVVTDQNTGAVYIAFAASYPDDNASRPPFGPHRKIIVAGSFDGGTTWANSVAFEGPPGTAVGNIFPAFAIDQSGNLFLVFAANLDRNLQLTPTGTLNIFFTRSTDRGATWSRAVQVNNDVGSHVLPWAVAGCEGKVDIVWYGTSAVGNPNAFPASGTDAPDWHVYLAQTLDGLSETPTFTQVQVSDHVVHRGQISTGGLLGSADRRLLDFFEVDHDSAGMAHIVWADTGTSATAGAQVYYARQTSGSGILGCSTTPPTPPTVEGPQVIQGTYDPHVYPCATQKHRFNVGPGKQRIVVQVSAQVPTNDISVSLLYGADPNPALIRTEDTGTCCEALIYEPAGGVPAGEYQVQICQTPNTAGVPQLAPFNYNGTFTADATTVTTPTPTPAPLPTPTPAATPLPGPVAPPATFGHNTLADFTAVAGEPFIRVDKQDNVFVSAPFGVSTTVSLLWKSTDRGRTFLPLGTPLIRDGVIGPGGGDTHHDFDDRNRLYYSDLSAGCVTVAVSEDGGNTFSPGQNNYTTCVGSGENPSGAQDDRQWIAAFGDGIAYMTVRNLAVSTGDNFHLSKTTDAGRTWHGQTIGSVTQSGPLQVDKVKRKIIVNGNEKDAILLYQLYYTSNTLKLFRIIDFNDGTPIIVNDLTIGTPGGSVDTVFPVLSVDKAGNLYVVWSNGSKISLATSMDRGQTWSAPKEVSPPSLAGANVMPWIVAGDPGRIDVVWYRTPGANDANAVWDIHMAQSLDALSAAPSFTVNKVNENTIHHGEICLDGLGCDLSTLQGTPRDRSFLEFPSIDIDSRGAAYITYNDSTNQLPVPYVMVARQIGGASLFASVGSVTEGGGTVTITEPAAGETVRTETMTLRGTHTLTPANFDPDETGDARFPDHGASIGNNIPALDLKAVSLSDDANSVTVTMQVGDLTTAALATAPALAGGDGLLYLTQMHYGNNVHWVGAEIRAGQASFLTGDLGSINSATSKKYVTYNPDAVSSLSVQGQIINTAPGRITMRLPKSLLGNPTAGTKFTSVTGYAFSERGPLLPMAAGTSNVSSLPVQVDASGAITYTIGDAGPRSDGVVEVSLDDPNFGSPRVATLPADAVNDSSWQLQLSGSDLVAGTHTAYVRQRINGREQSPVVSVSFTVANTIEQVVNSMISLATSNARSSSGVSSYDLTIRNTSSQSIYTPLRLELASLTSASGRVTVANADNSVSGAGAIWDYSSRAGADGTLSASELSGARNLRFNNPNNEPFTVTFNVVGNLNRSGISSNSSSSTSSTGESTEGSGTASQGTIKSAAGPVSWVFAITYNPLLNIASVELVQP